MKKLAACLMISCLPLTVAATPQDHQPAKMLTQSDAHKDKVMRTVHKERKVISQNFSKAYGNAGQPAIAIFWNRKFDDQLSQWYQTLRYSKTGESSVKGQDKFEPSSGSSKEGYQRNISGGGKIVSSEYVEKRVETEQREGLNEADQFAFASGFTSTFLSVPAKILDRDAIMRIVQRDNAKQAGAEMISDYQKIESDALIGYADYLAEVILTKDDNAPTGWAFLVSVKSVSDGQIVAMFKSNGETELGSNNKAKWTAGENGYTKDQNKIGAPNDVGEQLAYETMAALSRVWK
jgi:hypothetical protein